MNFIVREAVASDAEAIYRLNCDEMGYVFPIEATKTNIKGLLNKSSHKIYVAVIEDLVVGYIHADDYDLIYANPMKNIMGIAVSSKYKNNGIGRALIQQVEQWAYQTGSHGVRIVSGMDRTDAHAFYHKCGYSEDKKQLNLKKTIK